MSDSPEFVTTLTLVDNASKALGSIEASAKKVAGVFDVLLGIENKLSGFDRPLDRISDGMSNVADSTTDAQKAVSQLSSGLDDLERSTKRLSIGDIFKTIASNGANIFGMVQMASGMLNGFQSAMKTVDDNTNLIARLGAVARNEGIAIENKEAWQGRAEEIRKMLSQQAISLGLDSTAYANNAITFANNPAFKNIEEASRFSELMSKQFFASGVGGQAQMSVVNQLTQGLGKGRLQGEDLMSVLSNAPDMGRLLEEAYARVNHVELDKVTGHVRELASEGKLTADVIKDAFFGAAEKIEANFEEMPNTFEDMLTKFRDTVFEAFQPIMQLLMKIGNSDEFKSILNSISSIISSLTDLAGVLSPLLSLSLEAVAAFTNLADVLVSGIAMPFSMFNKKLNTKPTTSELTAQDQRSRILKTLEDHTKLMEVNTGAIESLSNLQKQFNERANDLFNYGADFQKRTEAWLKDYQHSHVEEIIGQFTNGGVGTPYSNESIENMRAQLLGSYEQGSIFNIDQYNEAAKTHAKATEEVEKFEKAINDLTNTINTKKSQMMAIYEPENAQNVVEGFLSGNIPTINNPRTRYSNSTEEYNALALAQSQLEKLKEAVSPWRAQLDNTSHAMELYRNRMEEWMKLTAENTGKTAKNTRRVSINKDDILFLKNIATAQIIYNYNNNTNTANFNQSFGSGSPSQVRKASQDGWGKAMRGTSSAL